MICSLSSNQVIASWIYSASTLHAAVNFPQKPSMSFVPSCPGSMFAPIPTDKVLIWRILQSVHGIWLDTCREYEQIVVLVALAFPVSVGINLLYLCCFTLCSLSIVLRGGTPSIRSYLPMYRSVCASFAHAPFVNC